MSEKKNPIWVDDYEAEVLLGFVGEALDEDLPEYAIAVLEKVYNQLEAVMSKPNP